MKITNHTFLGLAEVCALRSAF